MATAQEKEALGLSADASDEEVAARISELTSATQPDFDAVRAEAAQQARDEARADAEANAQANADRKISDLQRKVDDLTTQLSTTERSPTMTQPLVTGARVRREEGGTEVTIKIRAFPYYRDIEDPVTGLLVRREEVAVRGQTVVLNDADLSRAKEFDAIQTDSDKDLQGASGGALGSFEEATVGDLAEWLQGELPGQDGTAPSEDEVVEAADEDYEVALKLVEAENVASGGQPREDLVERLQNIADANNPTGAPA